MFIHSIKVQTNSDSNKMKKIDAAKPHLTIAVQSQETISHPESLHNTMSFVILLSQFFGIMPLYGITGKDYRTIKFRWKSLRFLYTFLNISGALTSAIFCIIQFAMVGLMLDKTATLSFYVCNFFGALYFVRVARNWSSLIREWTKVEISMKNYGFPPNLKRRFKVMTTIVLVLALMEHLLFVLNALNSMWNCRHHESEIYFAFAFPQVFSIVSYTHWKAALMEIVNILATFCWNFLDLFIMLLSSALAMRFRQVSRRIQTSRVMYETFWKKIREDYNRLTILCTILDKHMGPLVTISFISNLFFICIQLYNSLKPRYGFIPAVYFFYSFGFLLGRTLAVAMYAAWINDESREPLRILHSVPSENYCAEIERLIQQIHTNPAGITGSKLFMITRSFLLKIAGTIVTFELMLLQFGPLIHEDLNPDPTQLTIENCVLLR